MPIDIEFKILGSPGTLPTCGIISGGREQTKYLLVGDPSSKHSSLFSSMTFKENYIKMT